MDIKCPNCMSRFLKKLTDDIYLCRVCGNVFRVDIKELSQEDEEKEILSKPENEKKKNNEKICSEEELEELKDKAYKGRKKRVLIFLIFFLIWISVLAVNPPLAFAIMAVAFSILRDNDDSDGKRDSCGYGGGGDSCSDGCGDGGDGGNGG